MSRLPLRLVIVLFACSTALLSQKALTAEDVITLPRVGDPQIAPDGSVVAYVVGEPSLETNKVMRHIWLVATDGKSEPKQITKGDGETNPRWSPDGKTIAFIAKKAGEKDGVPQIHLMSADGSGARALTSLSTGAGGPVWSPDGTKIAFTSEVWPQLADDVAQKAEADRKEKEGVKAMVFTGLLYRHWSSYNDGKRSQLFVADVKDGKTTQITKEARDVPPFSLGGPPDYAFSADSGRVYFTRGPGSEKEAWTTNADLCVVGANGGDVTSLTVRNNGWDGSPCPSPDGKWVAYRSQAREGYESDLFRLMLLDTATGATKRIGGELTDHVDEMAWLPDGKLLVSTEKGGAHHLQQVPVDGAKPEPWPMDINVSSLSMARNGVFAATQASLVSPPEIVTMRGDVLAPLTSHTKAVIKDRTMPTRESFTWKGGLDATVQGWIVKPPGFDAKKKYPLIVFIHGGPQGAWMDAWSTRWNPAIYASAGYVVFAPNPHGSTGFGHPFCEQISKDWGGAVFEDLKKGVDAVVALDYVDPARMGAAGGSYGGYMVNWILGHDHRFKALVSHAGVYNLESMYGATEELWFPEWEFGCPPWENRELYDRWSPHRFAATFKTPTLVIHGELDYRVPVTQGMELFTALQRRGVPSKFLYYPDEGHWVLKPRNSRLWNQTVMAWFDQWLKK